MDFPKKQAQRLMPLYLLEYSEKLFTNHPNPEDPWGGGSDYTAGQGITITNNEISVDTNVIATKSDLPDFTKYYYVNNVIEENGEYFTKINGSGLEYSHPWSSNSISINVKNAELENKASIVVQNTGGNKIAISNRIDVYNDGSNTGVSVDGNKVVINSHQHITSLEDGKLVYDDLGQVREFNLPITNDPRTYTLATEEWVQNQGYLTNAGLNNYVTLDTDQTITGSKTFSSNLYIKSTNSTTSLGLEDYTLYFDNTSSGEIFQILPYKNFLGPGFYYGVGKDDLATNYYALPHQDLPGEYHYTLATTNDIPTVNDPTITFTQGGVTKGTITLNQSGDQTIEFDAGGTGTVAWDDITNKPTFATVATSGNYNDLTNKPSIPSTATSTSTSTVTPTTIELVFTYEDNTTQTITLMTGATVSTSTTTTLS